MFPFHSIHSGTATRQHGDGENQHTITVKNTTTTTSRRGRFLPKKKPKSFLILLLALLVFVSGRILVRLANVNQYIYIIAGTKKTASVLLPNGKKDDLQERKKSSLEEAHKKTSYLEFTASSCAAFKSGLPASSVGGFLITTLENKGNPFAINVYQRNDFVSNSVKEGGWELDKVDELNRYFIHYSRKHSIPLSNLTFVDIGSNIGWFALNMAALGVKVIAFEPMQENIDLIKESMCLSENLKSGVSDRITLFPHGLGARDEACIIYSHNINVGDGHVKCVQDQDESELNMPHDYSNTKGYIPMHRLDSAVDTKGENIVLVKMDTEGFEGNVFEGGKKFFLEGGIDVIVTEFVGHYIREKGGNPDEVLKLFFAAGYRALDGEKYMTEAEMMKLATADITLTLHSSSFRQLLR